MRESIWKEKSEDRQRRSLCGHTEISKFGYRRTSINDAQQKLDWLAPRSTLLEEEQDLFVAGWSDLLAILDSC